MYGHRIRAAVSCERSPPRPFKQDVIRHDNRCPAINFQNRFDVLKEVKLLVGSGRPKILPFIGERVFPRRLLFHPQS